MSPVAIDLKTEIDRQRETIEKLGDKYEYPLFNGRQAVESQRKSGYKNTARAAREIVDNAIEAGASQVHVVFSRMEESGTRAKGKWKNAVDAVAFIDDGPGMLPTMARFALTWGGGTRFNNPKGIGRFGFGLPNASINQTRLVHVFARTKATEPWMRATLDIREETLSAPKYQTGLVSVDAPVRADLPQFVVDYAKREGLALETGTVVVWDHPDRLTVSTANPLREHLLEDFGAVYRYLLSKFKLVVDGVRVEPVDPLFLMPEGRLYVAPEQGGAMCTLDKKLVVRLDRNAGPGVPKVRLLKTDAELATARLEGATVGVVEVIISRLPYGFAAESVFNEKGQKVWVPKDSDAYKRLQIRKARKGISYVRADREIDFIDNLPRSVRDRELGLGKWPHMQAYAMHYGVQLRFGPELDDAFNIGNDKQTVNPSEDMWRLLAEAKIDEAVAMEDAFQHDQRQRRRQAAAVAAAEASTDETVTSIAAQADAVMVSSPAEPVEQVEKRKVEFEAAVEKRAADTKQSKDEAAEALREEAKRKPYKVDFFTAQGGVFMEPSLGNGLQVVATINKAHPFYKEIYTRLAALPSPLARRALDLLLIALARAETSAKEMPKQVISNLREDSLSVFLKNAYNELGQIEQLDADDAQAEEVADTQQVAAQK